MKLSLVFIFVGVIHISASVYSQDARITINMKNVPLRTVLNELEKISHCTFFYNEDFIDLNRTVSIKVAESDMTSLLNTLFTNTGLTYQQIQDKMIVVAPIKFQQKYTVTGQVTDAANGGTSMAGVNIVEKGTTNGTITDANGNYTLTVSDTKSVIVYSFIGYAPSEATVDGRTTLNITLSEDVTALKEVVVTALGIQKKSRSLTYATQQVGGEELTGAKDVNLVNSLSGKSAGLVVGKSSSGVGGSSRVTIRGNKSISGENQPLYVIDGIPINNASFGQIGGNQLGGTVDGGDAISNINSEDIENISILKGASASALYGSLGENGVILITTKKGSSGKTTVEVSSATSFDSPLLLPKIQGTYGASKVIDLTSLKNDPSTWGAKNNGAISNSDLDKFFKTGVNTINGISITSGNDKNLYYMSYANTYSSGIVDKNVLTKNNFYVKGSSKLSNTLSVEGSANLITQNIKDRPYVGFYSNPVGEAYLYPGTSASFSDSKKNYQVWNAARGIYTQNNPYAEFNSTSFILDNPYWSINNNPNELKRSRSMFNGSLKWDITKELSLRARTNYDRIDDQFEQDVYATSSSVIWDKAGAYTLQKNTTNQMYSDVLLSYIKENINDFSINAAIGGSNNYSTGYALSAASVKGQDNFIGTNIFSLSNLTGSFTHAEATVETLNQSVFGTASIGYKNTYFVDVTARNEWASTISNQSFFYPSVGGSVILTELTGTNNVLSFIKLRASYSEVGNALPPGVNNGKNTQYWSIVSGTTTSPQIGIPILADGSEIHLKPERSKSTEIGANIRLFSNSIDLDVTYYNNTTLNQYFAVDAPLGAYVPKFYVNAGEIRNRGLELVLGYKYATHNGLQYATSFNFAYNDNKIISVNDATNLNSLTITGYNSTKVADIRMVKGGQFGDFYVSDFLRDAKGKVVLDATPGKEGTPQSTATFVKAGNPYSPTQLGWSNTFGFKGFSFRFLIDGKFGGNVISLTEADLDQDGRSQRTADSRDAGKVIFEGQTVASTPAQIQNWYSGLHGISKNYVYSATNVRLREITLGYNVPVIFTKGLVKNLNVSLYGKNLMFIYNKAPFDPEVSSSSTTGLQGIDGLSMPSTRSYGFSLKATF